MTRKPFKRPPKRFQPAGLAILHEDWDILVADKVSGLLTVSTEKVKRNTAYCFLMDYVRKGNPKSPHRVYIVHRLDRDTSGLLLLAKTAEAKRFLQAEWARFEKKYFALVHGRMPEEEGILASHLAENRFQKVYSVADPRKGKLARTSYRVLRKSRKYSLLELELHTGRKNQIRVQLADAGCPVVGDKKYGVKERGILRLALHATSMEIVHPHSREPMSFTSKLPPYFESFLR